MSGKSVVLVLVGAIIGVTFGSMYAREIFSWPLVTNVIISFLIGVLVWLVLWCAQKEKTTASGNADSSSMQSFRDQANKLGELYRANQLKLNMGALGGLFAIATWLADHKYPLTREFLLSGFPFLAGLVITQVSGSLAKLRFAKRWGESVKGKDIEFPDWMRSYLWDAASLALFAAGVVYATLTFPLPPDGPSSSNTSAQQATTTSVQPTK
jgi:hypothetical protein